jgi:hypothetical protein
MPALLSNPHAPTRSDASGDALVERLRTLPEADAVRYYAALPSRWQWFVRQRLTGVRRSALIVHHATSIIGCK